MMPICVYIYMDYKKNISPEIIRQIHINLPNAIMDNPINNADIIYRKIKFLYNKLLKTQKTA